MHRRPRQFLGALLLVWLVAGLDCQRNDGPAVLVVDVSVQGSPPPVLALAVDLTSNAGTVTRRYTHSDGTPIIFPTTLAAEIQTKISGEAAVDISAFDAQGGTVARGRQAGLTLRSGSKQTVSVSLACAATACGQDGGAGDGAVPLDGAGSDAVIPTCGNGNLDPGETCDTAIATGQPGACPPDSCDDGSPCTDDRLMGSDCTATCVHTERPQRIPGDGCCPTGARNADDPDCSATCGNGTIEAGETCDTAIPVGAAGACPTAATCVSADSCSTVLLTSPGTCQSRCLLFALTAPSGARSDGCCPSGATAALDVDCPGLCGDGVLDPGEMCDPALAPPSAGACPASCDDGNPCTADQRNGTGCEAACTHTPITSMTAGDGCCPSGSDRNRDSDCPAKCGNGVLEEGEACDFGQGSPVPCPTSCPASPSACLKRVMTGDRDHCSAGCAVQLVTACSLVKDGCCPGGCTASSDADCSPTCGDGVASSQLGELCDTAITSGPSACPTHCSDGLSCTADFLVSAGTCQAACVFLPITAFVPGDGCCPSGGHFGVDPDCAPVCGNGVVESPVESCDFAADPAACAGACPPSNGCRVFSLEGNARACTARCVASAISACRDGDGCCPPRCNNFNDNDCAPQCGNGVVEPGESCDRGITAGLPGSCPASCDDGDACTVDFTGGMVSACTRTCSHAPVTACVGGDHCCPAGCGPMNDADCAAGCGDGLVGGGETCDPPTSCPTTCPDDGDRCTTERLVGDPARCTAACAHFPVTACSGTVADGCCPTGCDASTDTDC